MESDLYIRIKNFLTCLSHIIKHYKYLDDFGPKGNIIHYIIIIINVPENYSKKYQITEQNNTEYYLLGLLKIAIIV